MTLGWKNHPVEALGFEYISSEMMTLQACITSQMLAAFQHFSEQVETYTFSQKLEVKHQLVEKPVPHLNVNECQSSELVSLYGHFQEMHKECISSLKLETMWCRFYEMSDPQYHSREKSKKCASSLKFDSRSHQPDEKPEPYHHSCVITDQYYHSYKT